MIQDRWLVGEAVRMLMDAGGLPKREFAKQSGVSRPTIYRIFAGDPAVEQATLRKVETGLSLPYDTLTLIALHDWRSLVEIGADADLVRWARRRARIRNDAAEVSGSNEAERRTRPGARRDGAGGSGMAPTTR